MAWGKSTVHGGGRFQCLAMHPTDASQIVAGCDVGGSAYTSDGGLTWKMTNALLGLATPRQTVSMMFDRSGVGAYKLTKGGFFYGPDGVSWTLDTTAGAPFSSQVATGGTGNDMPRRTGGLICQDASGAIVCSNDQGISRKSAGTWSALPFPTNNTGITCVTNDPNSLNTIYASTLNGIYRCDNVTSPSWVGPFIGSAYAQEIRIVDGVMYYITNNPFGTQSGVFMLPGIATAPVGTVSTQIGASVTPVKASAKTNSVCCLDVQSYPDGRTVIAVGCTHVNALTNILTGISSLSFSDGGSWTKMGAAQPNDENGPNTPAVHWWDSGVTDSAAQMTSTVGICDILLDPGNPDNVFCAGHFGCFRVKGFTGLAPDPTTGSTLHHDDFNRNVVNAWGTASDGSAWTPLGAGRPASAYQVDGVEGKVTIPTGDGNSYVLTLSNNTYVDVDVTAKLLISQQPQGVPGTSSSWSLLARFLDVNNYYRASLIWDVDGTQEIRISKSVANVNSSLNTRITPPFTIVGGNYYWVRFRVQSNHMWMWTWQDGDVQQTSPNIGVLDSSISAAGAVGVRLVQPGTSTAPMAVSYDEFTASVPPALTSQPPSLYPASNGLGGAVIPSVALDPTEPRAVYFGMSDVIFAYSTDNAVNETNTIEDHTTNVHSLHGVCVAVDKWQRVVVVGMDSYVTGTDPDKKVITHPGLDYSGPSPVWPGGSSNWTDTGAPTFATWGLTTMRDVSNNLIIIIAQESVGFHRKVGAGAWTVPTGLPTALPGKQTSFATRDAKDGKVACYEHSTGLWVSSDYGASWSQILVGTVGSVPSSPVTYSGYVAVDPNNSDLYVTTTNKVYRVTGAFSGTPSAIDITGVVTSPGQIAVNATTILVIQKGDALANVAVAYRSPLAHPGAWVADPDPDSILAGTVSIWPRSLALDDSGRAYLAADTSGTIKFTPTTSSAFTSILSSQVIA